MFAYIAKRLLATIPVMAVVAIFVFAMLRMTPGDPASIIAGAAATTQDVDAIRDAMLLLANDPVLCASLAAAGALRATHFSWKSCADQVLSVYRKVLQR